MPKQMEASAAIPRQQMQQGDAGEVRDRRTPRPDAKHDLAETATEQMQATHFSDWASI